MQYTHGGDIYTYGEMIDFSVNINPLGPSKKVIEAAKRALLQSAAYPDCKCRKLREKLADRLRVDERMFAFGNGAAELLYTLVLAEKSKKALLPIPSFSEYEQALKTVGCEIKYYQTKKNNGFCIDYDFLEERITKDGIVKEGNVLKVDSFLNHQMDIQLFDEIGEEFKRRFANEHINKILTIEASGIGIACMVARHFDVPVVFAKKSKSINIEGEMYVAEVESFTHKCKNQVIVSKKFLSPDDHVLIIDDFLANGCALQGLISIVNEAGATVEGIGIVIEKGFQSGGRIIRNLGYHLESLAIVDSMDAATGTITFRQE